MRIFGFEFRKFEKEPTTVQVIETWCVKWWSLHRSIIDKGNPEVNVQGFPTREAAEFYAKELRDARALLGDKGFGVEVYVQKLSTNA